MARITKAERELQRRADACAQAATYNNPVPILELGRLSRVVRAALESGASDADATEAGRAFIHSLRRSR